MNRGVRYIVLIGYLCGATWCFAQGRGMGDLTSMPGGMEMMIMGGGGEMLNSQDEQVQKYEKVSPILFKYKKRLLEIDREVQSTVKKLFEGEVNRDEAANTIRSLIKEQIEIQNNAEYQAEQKVVMLLDNPMLKFKSQMQKDIR